MTSCLTSLLISVASLSTRLDHSPYFLPGLISLTALSRTSLNSVSADAKTLSKRHQKDRGGSGLSVREPPVSRDQGQDGGCSLPSVQEHEGLRGGNESEGRWRARLAPVTDHFQLGPRSWIWAHPWAPTLIPSFASIVFLPPAVLTCTSSPEHWGAGGGDPTNKKTPLYQHRRCSENTVYLFSMHYRITRCRQSVRDDSITRNFT